VTGKGNVEAEEVLLGKQIFIRVNYIKTFLKKKYFVLKKFQKSIW